MVNINGTTITITRGDTLEALLEILCADGQPYEVRPGDVIRFALKQKYTDREPLLLKEIPHDTLLLRLEAEETKLLTAGWAHSQAACLHDGSSPAGSLSLSGMLPASS